jgi:hypothetical protein
VHAVRGVRQLGEGSVHPLSPAVGDAVDKGRAAVGRQIGKEERRAQMPAPRGQERQRAGAPVLPRPRRHLPCRAAPAWP